MKKEIVEYKKDDTDYQQQRKAHHLFFREMRHIIFEHFPSHLKENMKFFCDMHQDNA